MSLIPYLEVMRYELKKLLLIFQPNQQASDNFKPVNLSWLRCNTDPDVIQGQGLAFLEDPLKISDDK